MDLAAKRRVGRTRMDQDGVRPGGMRVPALSLPARVLRKGLFLLLAPTRLSPDKGLAVFNRSAHSAGPGLFMQWCEDSMSNSQTNSVWLKVNQMSI